MRLPCVIDNLAHTLVDILSVFLRADAVHTLDVATAYFNVGGFALVREGLEALEQDGGPAEPLTRDELHLVCWEWVWS